MQIWKVPIVKIHKLIGITSQSRLGNMKTITFKTRITFTFKRHVILPSSPSSLSFSLSVSFFYTIMISRSKIEHIVCLALNGINIALYLLVITAVIFKCIQGNFADIVMGIYGM
jgi:hypothetical protein